MFKAEVVAPPPPPFLAGGGQAGVFKAEVVAGLRAGRFAVQILAGRVEGGSSQLGPKTLTTPVGPKAWPHPPTPPTPPPHTCKAMTCMHLDPKPSPTR